MKILNRKKFKISRKILWVFIFLFSIKYFGFSLDVSEIMPESEKFILIDSSNNGFEIINVAKEALPKNKYLLHYDKHSFENVFMEGDKSYSPIFNKVGSEWRTEIVKDGHEVKYSDLSEYHEFFDKGKYFYLVQFFSWQPELKACPIGKYIVEIYFNNEVYSFTFEDPLSIVRDEKMENLLSQMKDYVHLKTIYEEDEFGSYSQVKTYCWKTSASRYQFFKDMRNKNPYLPEYVLDFQEKYEKCLRQIIDFFDDYEELKN